MLTSTDQPHSTLFFQRETLAVASLTIYRQDFLVEAIPSQKVLFLPHPPTYLIKVQKCLLIDQVGHS